MSIQSLTLLQIFHNFKKQFHAHLDSYAIARCSTIFKMIESQSDFSQTPGRSPNPRLLFARIVRRIGGGQLGLRLHSLNGQITELEKFREL